MARSIAITVNGPNATSPCDHAADLVDPQRHDPGKSTLIADRRPEPLAIVHLALDRTHCCEAGSAEQIECEERIGNERSEGNLNVGVPTSVAVVEDAERTDHVLFRDKARDRSGCRLPIAPSERIEDPADERTEHCQDRIILILDRHEGAIHNAIGRDEPHQDAREQDDSTGLLDEGPSTFPHAAQHRANRWHMVCRAAP